jgi:hypothetical protein
MTEMKITILNLVVKKMSIAIKTSGLEGETGKILETICYNGIKSYD